MHIGYPQVGEKQIQIIANQLLKSVDNLGRM
jgi:hypothetical protein